MAFLGQRYDLNNIPPAGDFKPLPSGEYLAIIVDSAMKPTKAGNGQYLELVHEIVDGPLKGQKVWGRLNLSNPNAKTVQIAQEQLSSIGHAVGVLNPQDSQEFHNKPLVIRVEFVPAGANRDRDGNEIKAWKRYEGSAVPAAAQAPMQPAAPVTAPAANTLPPWQRPRAA